MKTEGHRLRVSVLAIYWAFLFAATTIPSSWFGRAPVPQSSDKVAHFLSYGVLAFLFLRAQRNPSRRVIVKATLILFAYGAFDEWHQPYFGRSCELMDFVADALGICTGIAAWMAIHRLSAPKAGLSP